MTQAGEYELSPGKKFYADKNIGFAISEELCQFPGMSTELREQIAEHLEKRLPAILVWVQAEDEDMAPRLPTRDELNAAPAGKLAQLLVDALD